MLGAPYGDGTSLFGWGARGKTIFIIYGGYIFVAIVYFECIMSGVV